MVSAASLTITLSIRLHTIADTMANSSANPGLTPDTKIVEPPWRQAARIRSRPAPRLCPVMNAAVVTTFTPADKMRTSSSTSIHIGL